MYDTGLEGPFLGAFDQTGAANAEAVESAVLALTEQAEIIKLLQTAG